MQGLDLTCQTLTRKKYYQRIVLVNKADVLDYVINTSGNNHNIYFSLKPGAIGYLFLSTEIGATMSATFNKSDDNGIPVYTHSCSLPIVGVDGYQKTLLQQLDNANYFAAILYNDSTVEILGFKYSLKTSDYSYEPQGSLGGAVLQLTSKFTEYVPPYNYLPKTARTEGTVQEQAVADFDDLFVDIPEVRTGDFNDDFNIDFNIDL